MSKRFPRKPLMAAVQTCAYLCAFAAHAASPSVSNTFADVAAQLQAPPLDARPMMRWWWFGPAVVKPELEREILAMKAGGIGGFEIQPVYPMALDDAARGIHNTP